jgi:Na+-translocating ferredoxin:NAD+ oxidoreductase RnfG subunit
LVHKGYREGRFLGDAVVTEETGLFKKITFIVHVRPEGKVGRVAVLTYREPRGMEVRKTRFLKQYEGKSTGDPIALNRDIVNITGATLSARAMSAGVKKILHFVMDVYRPAVDKKGTGKK